MCWVSHCEIGMAVTQWCRSVAEEDLAFKVRCVRICLCASVHDWVQHGGFCSSPWVEQSGLCAHHNETAVAVSLQAGWPSSAQHPARAAALNWSLLSFCWDSASYHRGYKEARKPRQVWLSSLLWVIGELTNMLVRIQDPHMQSESVRSY